MDRLCALQGHQTIAGGNAPGQMASEEPTLQGSHGDGTLVRAARLERRVTPSGSAAQGGSPSGGVAPGYYMDPLRGSNLRAIGVKMSHYPASGSHPRAL